MSALGGGTINDVVGYFDTNSEEAVLGVLMRFGESADALEGFGLCDDYFSPVNQPIFQAICKLRGKRVPTHSHVVVTALRGDGVEIDTVEAARIFGMESEAVPLSGAAYFGDKIRVAAHKRKQHDIAKRLSEAVAAGEAVSEFPRLRDEWEALSLSGSGLLQRAEGVLFDPNCPPPIVPAVYTVGGVDACHSGNLTVIEAHIKTGKSAFVGSAIASTLLGARGDFLGWGSDGNPKRKAVLHFDTEQSHKDHFKLGTSAMIRAGASVRPPWFKSYRVKGWTPTDIKELIRLTTAEAKTRHGGVHSIFIDGPADLVSSVNDEAESFEAVRWLESVAVERDCPVIAVIHLNPMSGRKDSPEKSRGHLGSQLNRKAETVLRLTKDGEVTTATTPAARNAPIPHDRCPRFIYSEEARRHITAPTVDEMKETEELTDAMHVVRAVWKDDPEAQIRRTDFEVKIMSFCRCSENTAKRKIGAIMGQNLVSKFGPSKLYGLTERGAKLILAP